MMQLAKVAVAAVAGYWIASKFLISFQAGDGKPIPYGTGPGLDDAAVGACAAGAYFLINKVV
jgi:hypothetical protein